MSILGKISTIDLLIFVNTKVPAMFELESCGLVKIRLAWFRLQIAFLVRHLYLNKEFFSVLFILQTKFAYYFKFKK